MEAVHLNMESMTAADKLELANRHAKKATFLINPGKTYHQQNQNIPAYLLELGFLLGRNTNFRTTAKTKDERVAGNTSPLC